MTTFGKTNVDVKATYKDKYCIILSLRCISPFDNACKSVKKPYRRLAISFMNLESCKLGITSDEILANWDEIAREAIEAEEQEQKKRCQCTDWEEFCINLKDYEIISAKMCDGNIDATTLAREYVKNGITNVEKLLDKLKETFTPVLDAYASTQSAIASMNEDETITPTEYIEKFADVLEPVVDALDKVGGGSIDIRS